MSASTVYVQPRRPSIAWPEPMESVYQRLPRSGGAVSGARRPDISWAERLFMSAVVAIPREERYGAVSWTATALGVSRQMVYDVAGLVHRCVGGVDGSDGAPSRTPAEVGQASDWRLERAALTLLFPGGVTLRPMTECLAELVGRPRSVGWLSEFFNEAGRRAGLVLEATDWLQVSPFVAARDEKFFDDRAYLLTVEPKSLAIISGHVEDGVDADRWAVSLALDQERTGHRLVGLAEDAAAWYPASVSAAAALTGTPYLMPVQKDHFHVLRRAGQTLRRVENAALQRLATAERKATVMSPGWTRIRDFDGWQEAHRAANEALERAQELHFWTWCLADALELVEPQSGSIRDAQTATWYLDQILDGLATVADPQVRSFTTYVRNQRHRLFTFLEWLAYPLEAWRQQCIAHFGDPALADYFERSVARAWRLTRAERSGSRRLASAVRARGEVEGQCQNDPTARRLAFALAALLDEAVRTTSAAEAVNGILERYVRARRSFPDRTSAEHYLNLLVLWHGLRRFQRGKRKGRSPFEIMGVRVFDPTGQQTDDWRAALGYPAAA